MTTTFAIVLALLLLPVLILLWAAESTEHMTREQATAKLLEV